MEKESYSDIYLTAINELKKIKFNFQDILAIIPTNIYWKDKNGVYLRCNNALAHTLGLMSTSDIIGKTDVELWPEQASALIKNDQKVMQTGKIIKFKEKVKMINGALLLFVSIKAPWRNKQKNIIGVIGNSMNITGLKNAKEIAEATNQSKTQFLTNINHEFGTPLQATLREIKSLQKRAQTIGLPNSLDTIEETIKEFLQSIEDTLNSSGYHFQS